MVKVYVHFWNEFTNYDEDLFVIIEMPFAPSIGDFICLSKMDYDKLDEEVISCDALKKRYSYYFSGGVDNKKYISFCDSIVVIHRFWDDNKKQLHIHLSEE